MFADSSRKTSRYKRYVNNGEVILGNGGTAMFSLNPVEKRLKLIDGRNKYSTLEDDCEETVFHENNNPPTTPPCDGLSTREKASEVTQSGSAKTSGNRRNIFYSSVIVSLLVFAVSLKIIVFKAQNSSGTSYHLYFAHEVVLHNLTIDSNMATLSMPDGTRALYFCARNTVVCSKTDESSLIWKRALIHKIEIIQCNDAACIAYGNNTITALEPTHGGFMWTLRIKAQPYLMKTSWGGRIVVFHNEYMIIYRQDTGRATTHIRIKNCTRINRIQPVGARLAVLCQQGLNTTSASLYIIPKSVLLHFTPQNGDKPIPADFAGFFKLPVRLHTFNETVLYILHDKGVVSTLSITERKIEDILSAASDNVKDLLPLNSTHTLIQTVDELKIYTSGGIAWRKNIKEENLSYIRRLDHNLIMLKNTDGRLTILDIISKSEACLSSGSSQELLLVNGTDRVIFFASLQEPNATTVKTVYYH